MKVFVSALLAVGCLLVLPSTSMAVVYTVDSTLDEPDANPGTGGCVTAGGKCTLRAAIQESNASTLVVDEIQFDGTFDGQLVDTITLGSLLPPITNPVGINAGSCPTQAGQGGPCAGVEASALSYGLSVENTDTVQIAGLAITGATTGIRVVDSSKTFVAQGNWLGLKLDGSNGSGANTGIWLDPDSNGATIGGIETVDRNVFANNAAEGLDIEGADNTKVRGNYFGVKADGVTRAANGRDIELTDTAAFAATGNEIGDTIAGAAAPCDEVCNLISGATTAGINLQGDGGNEKPATGPTTIHGNFFGLNAAGTSAVANDQYGVFVGEASEVTIGGPTGGDVNYIAGGGTGIFQTNGEGLEVLNNLIGSGPVATNFTSPSQTGIFLLCLENDNPVLIYGNTIKMEGGVGIESRFGGAEIVGKNLILGAELGILTKAEPGPAGANLIENNEIEESTANGIRIENDGNLVFGNSIVESGGAGIRLQAPALLLHANENQIGGDTPASENTISESGTDAIEIDNTGEEEPSQNEIARNHGEKNGGLFIDLIGATTNGGIQPPTFATAIQSSAGGTAEPGALVRVFRKKAVEAGELESFLGEAVADGSGNWKVTYSSQIPIGTLLMASQTNTEGGTSELKMTVTSADPSNGGGGGKDDKGKDDKAKSPTDKAKDKGDSGKGKALETTIGRVKVQGTTVKVRFSSSEKGAKFECKLDRKPFKACKSPKTYKKLKPGKHVFKVRAVKGKDADPTPAKRKFKVLG